MTHGPSSTPAPQPLPPAPLASCLLPAHHCHPVPHVWVMGTVCHRACHAALAQPRTPTPGRVAAAGPSRQTALGLTGVCCCWFYEGPAFMRGRPARHAASPAPAPAPAPRDHRACPGMRGMLRGAREAAARRSAGGCAAQAAGHWPQLRPPPEAPAPLGVPVLPPAAAEERRPAAASSREHPRLCPADSWLCQGGSGWAKPPGRCLRWLWD